MHGREKKKVGRREYGTEPEESSALVNAPDSQAAGVTGGTSASSAVLSSAISPSVIAPSSAAASATAVLAPERAHIRKYAQMDGGRTTAQSDAANTVRGGMGGLPAYAPAPSMRGGVLAAGGGGEERGLGVPEDNMATSFMEADKFKNSALQSAGDHVRQGTGGGGGEIPKDLSLRALAFHDVTEDLSKSEPVPQGGLASCWKAGGCWQSRATAAASSPVAAATASTGSGGGAEANPDTLPIAPWNNAYSTSDKGYSASDKADDTSDKADDTAYRTSDKAYRTSRTSQIKGAESRYGAPAPPGAPAPRGAPAPPGTKNTLRGPAQWAEIFTGTEAKSGMSGGLSGGLHAPEVPEYRGLPKDRQLRHLAHTYMDDGVAYQMHMQVKDEVKKARVALKLAKTRQVLVPS